MLDFEVLQDLDKATEETVKGTETKERDASVGKGEAEGFPGGSSSQSTENITSVDQLKIGSTFKGSISIGKDGGIIEGTFSVINIKGRYFSLTAQNRMHYTVAKEKINIERENETETSEELQRRLAKKQQEQEEEQRKLQQKAEYENNSLRKKDYSVQLETLISIGIKNIWMVGPAGCGKTTMARNAAEKLGYDFYVVSCGIGTSAAEFVGYKYPQREATDFSKFYSRRSIILVDEFTALDPSIAQICNAALANGFINTTTGKVIRHQECIIIATSNTFGNGASRQYVANNQLDASTIDRFVGGMLEIDYSEEYESKFTPTVVDYVWGVRDVIKKKGIRRVASTRMIIEGEKLFNAGIADWKELLVSNWTQAEKELLADIETSRKVRVELLPELYKN